MKRFWDELKKGENDRINSIFNHSYMNMHDVTKILLKKKTIK